MTAPTPQLAVSAWTASRTVRAPAASPTTTGPPGPSTPDYLESITALAESAGDLLHGRGPEELEAVIIPEPLSYRLKTATPRAAARHRTALERTSRKGDGPRGDRPGHDLLDELRDGRDAGHPRPRHGRGRLHDGHPRHVGDPRRPVLRHALLPPGRDHVHQGRRLLRRRRGRTSARTSPRSPRRR